MTTGAAPIYPAVPAGAMRPVYGVCGNHYQEGAPASAQAPQCACGMFAVGRCADDGTWVCGSHGSMYGDGQFVCGNCWARRNQEAKAARQRQMQEKFDAAPLPTADLLGRIADGIVKCTTLKADFRLPGAQLAGLLVSRVEPQQVALHREATPAGRWGRKRLAPPVWVYAPGWELEKDRYRDTDKYLLVDGRQLTITRHSETDPGLRSYQGPEVSVEFDLLRPVLRRHFPVFRDIEWLLGDNGRPIGVVTASGGHESF